MSHGLVDWRRESKTEISLKRRRRREIQPRTPIHRKQVDADILRQGIEADSYRIRRLWMNML
jgi:hypothetical protein